MAALARFFHDGDFSEGAEIWLDEDTARHIVQVLRKQAGDKIELCNGRGYIAVATIIGAEKKKCKVQIGPVAYYEKQKVGLHLGIAFTKNSSRNEWLLEKATELGVHSIIPLSTVRTEKEIIRRERAHNILVSAMLQSQQYHLPVLHEVTTLKNVIGQHSDIEHKFVAHCINSFNKGPVAQLMVPDKPILLLIGPEGDFTEDEVQMLMSQGFTGISLGMQRLRTETAGMAACAYFNLINYAKE